MINIGMVIGVMQVVGVPIPLMSYGGTSIITNFLAVGILINIRMRRLVLL
ncbi:Cell cycle protein [Candidatus Magnetobacterium bavaricum]|uniref:Cell cycle protein n=1 Tax=Candidatus Magnetobacterium bavaricum TaxID=29290 RepID=A0A0F3GU15_9BACT|nr:Cell cycle protein [Candidatus Magnetobacterium bavaricum]